MLLYDEKRKKKFQDLSELVELVIVIINPYQKEIPRYATTYGIFWSIRDMSIHRVHALYILRHSNPQIQMNR